MGSWMLLPLSYVSFCILKGKKKSEPVDRKVFISRALMPALKTTLLTTTNFKESSECIPYASTWSVACLGKVCLKS